mgnify:CR=1 FL=1
MKYVMLLAFLDLHAFTGALVMNSMVSLKIRVG